MDRVEKRLIRNSFQCLECNEILISHYTHDYTTCKCPNSASTDGGLSYARYGAKDMSKLKDLCIYDDEQFESLRNIISRGGRGKLGDQPLKYVVLSNIDDEWLQAIIEYEEENKPNNPYLKYYKLEQKWREKK